MSAAPVARIDSARPALHLVDAGAVSVRLTWAECEAAILAGGHRRLRRLRKGTADAHRWGYSGEDNWTAHVEGVGAELAVAKVLDRYWFDDHAPDYEGDVGTGIQVRHTTRADGRLILHREDDSAQDFWLVRGQMPTFEVVGWISGGDGKQERFWTDPGTGRPAYFIPTDALRSPAEARR